MTTRDPLSPEDKQASAAASPGTQTIELLGVYPTAEQVETTVVVRGLFISRPAGARINVTSMELVHLHCRK